MTDDEPAEWVTIKVKEPARNAARDDPRTYTEILRAGLDGDVGDLEPFGGEVPDLSGLLEADKADIDALREQIDRIPERTADELEGRFR